MNKDESGSAFPHSNLENRYYAFPADNGLSIRDYFAAKAMQALIVAQSKEMEGIADETHREPEEIVSQFAYFYADAMLEERK